MKVAAFARTKRVLKCIDFIHQNGHEVVLIATDEPAPGYEIGVKEYEDYANSIGATFISTNTLKGEKIKKIIESSGAEIAISGNWLTLVPKSIIDIFKYGVLNAHAGDLPKYRGNAASNWAIINGEDEVVLTIHKMSPDLDAGDILVQKRFPLDQSTYIIEVRDFIIDNMPKMFLEAVNGLESNVIIPRNQNPDPKEALRVYARAPIDGKINWNDSAEMICRLIRASGNPFDGAYTYKGTCKLIIWKARTHYPEFNFSGSPGQIAYRDVNNCEVWVVCGEGMLILEEVTLQNIEGNCPTKVLNTIRIRLGMDQEGEICQLKERINNIEKLLNK